MSDVLRIETINAVTVEQRRRRKLRKASCKTCRDWADVIHGDYAGRREERWHSWPEPDRRCPTCGREPDVFVSKFAFDPGDPWDPAEDGRWRHPPGCTCLKCEPEQADRATEAAQEPRSRPASTPARVPVAPKSEQPAEPPNEPKRPSERTGKEWESQKSRRRGSLTRGIERREF